MREIIYKFINKHYYLDVPEGWIAIRDISDDKFSKNLESFIHYIILVFGISYHKAYLICEKWFVDTKKELTGRIIEHLQDYRVEMTMVDWVIVDKQGKEITLEALIGLLVPYYDSDKIIKVVTKEWFEEKQEEYLKKHYDFFG